MFTVRYIKLFRLLMGAVSKIIESSNIDEESHWVCCSHEIPSSVAWLSPRITKDPGQPAEVNPNRKMSRQ